MPPKLLLLLLDEECTAEIYSKVTPFAACWHQVMSPEIDD
jgi:hypothetical protein